MFGRHIGSYSIDELRALRIPPACGPHQRETVMFEVFVEAHRLPKHRETLSLLRPTSVPRPVETTTDSRVITP